MHPMRQQTTKIESPLAALSLPLLRWYRANARDLPWRQTDDPYRIWISEIMLQQTRVAAVLGYYERFLAAFPSVEALASAPEDRLMKLWEGLGYYSRVHNLQKAARLVAEQFAGHFPASYESLLALPGIGEYTAGAIASAAFGLPEPAVDGNVLRVITRLTDCHDDIMSPAVKRAVREQLRAVIPSSAADIRIFNQATMELGATVCVPNGPPKCEVCPAAAFCLGHIRSTAESLPVKAPKRKRRVEEKTVFLLLQEGRVALRRRPDTGLLAGLWEFPNLDGALDEPTAASAVEEWGLTPADWLEQIAAKHIFTHIEWLMTGYVLRVTGNCPEDFFWADAAALKEHAVPSAFARYYVRAQELLQE